MDYEGDSKPAAVTPSSSARTITDRPKVGPPLCRFYVLHDGACRFGNECTYSHELGPNETFETARRHFVCPYFLKGTCRYGDSFCRLSHDPQALLQLQQQQQQQKQQCPEVKGEEDDLVCGICFDSLLPEKNGSNHKQKSLGLLSDCDHAFCLDCLRQWRRTKQQESNRSCPICRTESSLIIPSRRYCVGAEKEAIRAAFLNQCAKRPCKNFTPGVYGSCRFGRDCLYAHLDIDGVTDIKSMDMEARRGRQRQGRDDDDDDDLDEFRADLDMFYIMMMMRFLLRDSLSDDSDDDDSYFGHADF